MISASWPMPKLAKKEVSDFQNRKIIRASSTTNSYSPQIIKALTPPGVLYNSDDPMYSTYDPNGSIPFPKQKAFDPQGEEKGERLPMEELLEILNKLNIDNIQKKDPMSLIQRDIRALLQTLTNAI
jgi:hypothetical protein